MKLRFSDLVSTNNHYYSLFKRVLLILAGILVTLVSTLAGGLFYLWVSYNSYKIPAIETPPPNVATKWLNTVERV